MDKKIKKFYEDYFKMPISTKTLVSELAEKVPLMLVSPPSCAELKGEWSSESSILLRDELHMLCPPVLLETMYALYDLNIQTCSCGSNGNNEVGVSCSYETLSDENKEIIDLLAKKGLIEIHEPCRHNGMEKRFRISTQYDEKTTIADTINSFKMKLADINFKQQDVLYGKTMIEHLDMSEFELLENGILKREMGTDKFDYTLDENGEITITESKEVKTNYQYFFLDDSGKFVWRNKELKNKHDVYLQAQKVKETQFENL